jgi:predicted esterase YcpF (UPF0227 family)
MKYLILITITILVIIFGSIWAFDVGIEGVTINPKIKPYIQLTTYYINEEEKNNHNIKNHLPPKEFDKIKEEIKERVN